AGAGVAVLEWGDAAAANEALAVGHDPVGGARAIVGGAQVVDLGIEDGEAGAAGAELGHHGADDGGDGSFIFAADGANGQARVHDRIVTSADAPARGRACGRSLSGAWARV